MKIKIERKEKSVEIEVKEDDLEKILEGFIAGLTGAGYGYIQISKVLVRIGKNYKKYL